MNESSNARRRPASISLSSSQTDKSGRSSAARGRENHASAATVDSVDPCQHVWHHDDSDIVFFCVKCAAVHA